LKVTAIIVNSPTFNFWEKRNLDAGENAGVDSINMHNKKIENRFLEITTNADRIHRRVPFPIRFPIEQGLGGSFDRMRFKFSTARNNSQVEHPGVYNGS
jgi:hypothetical protein